MSNAWNRRVIVSIAAGMLLVSTAFYRIGARGEVRAEHEPVQTGRRLSALPSGGDVVGIYKRAGLADPGAGEGPSRGQALATLRRLGGEQGRVRDAEAMMLASVLEYEVIPEALSVIDGFPEPARSEIGYTILYRWAQVEPLAAINYARSNFDNVFLRTGIPKMVGIWARDDPAAALGWYRSNRESTTEKALMHLFTAMAEIDLGVAIETAIDLNDEEDGLRVSSAWRGIASLVSVEPLRAQVVSAIEAIDDVDTRKLVGRDLLSLWARTDPVEAAAWLDRQGFVGEEFESAVLGQWTKIDPAAAADWTLGRLRGDQSQGGGMLGIVVEGWVRSDPESAGDWILRNGVSVEDSMPVMLENLAGRGEIVKAIAWAERGAEEDRDRLIAEAIALGVKYQVIGRGEIGKYSERGSLDPKAVAAEVEAALRR
ncbi:MAG: hypothetical protein ACR2RV_27855 [Verrucomicrobiales bacterium]